MVHLIQILAKEMAYVGTLYVTLLAQFLYQKAVSTSGQASLCFIMLPYNDQLIVHI